MLQKNIVKLLSEMSTQGFFYGFTKYPLCYEKTYLMSIMSQFFPKKVLRLLGEWHLARGVAQVKQRSKARLFYLLTLFWGNFTKSTLKNSYTIF